jgi:hypothetical protein
VNIMLQFSSNPKASFVVLLLLAFLLLHSSPGRAVEPRQPEVIADMNAGPVSAPVAAQGMRVYRDPKTGKLGAPPPGIQPPGLSIAEQQMLNRSDRGLRARTLPNGAVAVDLQGRFRSMAVATIRDGNKPAVQCEVTPREAEVALQSGMLPHVKHEHGEH